MGTADNFGGRRRARGLAALLVSALVGAGLVVPVAPAAAAACTPTTYGGKSACAETEPNDSTPTATTVPLSTPILGQIDGYSDSDVYRVEVAQAGLLTLDFRFGQSIGEPALGTEHYAFDIWIYTASNNFIVSDLYLLSGDHDGSRIRSYPFYVRPGTHYVSVSNGFVGENARYILSFSLTQPAGVRTEHEAENSYWVSPDDVKLGEVWEGTHFQTDFSSTGRDVYRFQASNTGQHEITLTFPKGLVGSLYQIELFRNLAGKPYLIGDLLQPISSWTIVGNSTGKVSLRTDPDVPLVAGAWYFFSVDGANESPSYGKKYRLSVNEILPPVTTKSVSVTGTVKVAKLLTAATGVWGPKPVTVKYEWLRDGKVVKTQTIKNASKATTSTYTPKGADAGKRLQVRVTGSKSGYASRSKTSQLTAKVKKGTLAAKPTPKVSGTAQVGKKLTVRTGSWKTAKVTLTVRWYRSGQKKPFRTQVFKNANGSKTAKVKLTTKDAGKTIRVKVTASKTGYASATKASKVTAKVRR